MDLSQNKMAEIIKDFLNKPLKPNTIESFSNEKDVDTSQTLTAKGVTMTCLFAASFIYGVLPIKLSQWFNWETSQKSKNIVMLLLCFGGGILMCTTFLHLLPEVTEEIDELTDNGTIPNLPVHFAPLLMCIGFFIMYFVEECVHVYIHRREKSNEMKKLKNALSVRRGERGSFGEINSTSNLVEVKGGSYSNSVHNLKELSDSNQIRAGHMHVIVEHQDSLVMSIRGLLIVLALSVHELFEGLAVGLEPSAAAVWYMFGAVAAHKLVIAFCIGVELVTGKTQTLLTVIYIFTFSVVSPLGIGIGIFLSADDAESAAVISVILQGLSTGTLLYVVYFEILQKEKLKGLKSYFAILIGFAVMLALTIAVDHH